MVDELKEDNEEQKKSDREQIEFLVEENKMLKDKLDRVNNGEVGSN